MWEHVLLKIANDRYIVKIIVVNKENTKEDKSNAST